MRLMSWDRFRRTGMTCDSGRRSRQCSHRLHTTLCKFYTNLPEPQSDTSPGSKPRPCTEGPGWLWGLAAVRKTTFVKGEMQVSVTCSQLSETQLPPHQPLEDRWQNKCPESQWPGSLPRIPCMWRALWAGCRPSPPEHCTNNCTYDLRVVLKPTQVISH